MIFVVEFIHSDNQMTSWNYNPEPGLIHISQILHEQL